MGQKRSALQPITPVLPIDIERFHTDGFISFPKVVAPEELTEVRKLLDPLFDRIDLLPRNAVKDLGAAPSSDHARSIPEIIRVAAIEPRLLRTAAFERCSSLAATLLGVRTYRWGGHAIYKPPHCADSTSWHQDQAYIGHGISLLSLPGVTVWLPLDAVDERSGCMRFLEKYHRRGLLQHHKRGNDPNADALELARIDTTAVVVVCPLPAGGVTVHTPFTPHGSGANESDSIRRAWIMTFSSCRRYGVRHLLQVGMRGALRVRSMFSLDKKLQVDKLT